MSIFNEEENLEYDNEGLPHTPNRITAQLHTAIGNICVKQNAPGVDIKSIVCQKHRCHFVGA